MAESWEKVSRITEALDRACRAGGFRDFMPEMMISHFVRQVVPVSFRENRLHLNQFYQWVRQEYSIPDHVFSRVFSRLEELLRDLQVKIVLPDSFEPSFDTAVMEWLKTEFKDVISADLKADKRSEEAARLRSEKQEPTSPAPSSSPSSSLPTPEVKVAGSENWDREIIDELLEAEKAVGPSAVADLQKELFAESEQTDSTTPSREVKEEPVTPQTPARSEEDLRAEVAGRLRAELWPEIYREVWEECRQQVRPLVVAELKEELKGLLENELRPQIASQLRAQLSPSLREQVIAELRQSERAQLTEQIRAELLPVVREELRKELWNEVREEVKEDLREIMKPVLLAELRAELQTGTSEISSPPRGSEETSLEELELPPHEAGLIQLGGMEDVDQLSFSTSREAKEETPRLHLAAEEQLRLIRRLRQELMPRLRDQLMSDLTTLVRLHQEKEAAEQRNKRLADPEYCREKIRAFLFPDQPSLWEKVKPLIKTEEWQNLVRLLEEGVPPPEQQKLNRARAVIREALKLKAEIEEEINYAPLVAEGSEAWTRRQNITKILAGADQLLDFALKNLSQIIAELAPSPLPSQV